MTKSSNQSTDAVKTAKKTAKKKPIRKTEQQDAADPTAKTKKVTKKTTKKTAKKKPETKSTTTTNSPGKSSRTRGSTNQGKDSSAAKKPRDVQTKEARKVVYNSFDVWVYKDNDPDISDGVMTVEIAKNLLGWQEESENIKFGNDYLFKDIDGNKIRCVNNLTNRPFDDGLARDWMFEILRGKWKLNGETMIIDKMAMIHDGQHRLVGLVWAEQTRLKNREDWTEYWRQECFVETVVVVGVEHDDDTINTINTGKSRTLSDVLYRTEHFKSYTVKERKKIAKACDFAIKLVYRRTGAADYSHLNGKLPHSESLEFLDQHPSILDCVKFIWDENGGSEKRITKLISPGMASGLLYMMAAERTERETYTEYLTEDGADMSLMDKAQEYWVALSQGGDDVKGVLSAVEEVRSEYSDYPKLQRDCIEAIVCKGWLKYSEDKKITKANVAAKVVEIVDDEDDPDSFSTLKLDAVVSLGGIEKPAE